MYDHLASAILQSILESIVSHAFAGFFCDEFDGLNHPVNNLVLYPRVLAFGVFSNCDDINVIVQSLEPLY